jgi:hypothetical protein
LFVGAAIRCVSCARDTFVDRLNCFLQLLRREILDLLVVNEPKVEQMVQAFEADGAEGRQAEEKLRETAVFVGVLLSAVVVETGVDFRSKKIDFGASLEDSDV